MDDTPKGRLRLSEDGLCEHFVLNHRRFSQLIKAGSVLEQLTQPVSFFL